MNPPPGFLTLASVEAARPVFMIVMGAFLLMIVWRLSARATKASRVTMRTGAALLAFGYAVLVPLYEAGKILPLGTMSAAPYSAEISLAGQIARLIAMNCGWALCGIGVAMHARLFETTRVRRPATSRAKAMAVHAGHETLSARSAV